jgi:hypothetical protein
VPIDSSWIYSKNGGKLSQIALDARPVAAVVVAGAIESWLRNVFLAQKHFFSQKQHATIHFKKCCQYNYAD